MWAWPATWATAWPSRLLRTQHEYYVVELSSFQLDDTHDFRPWLAVLLNITPDHLDRYGYSLENYAAAKMRIARNLDSRYFIYNAGDPETRKAVATSAFVQKLRWPLTSTRTASRREPGGSGTGRMARLQLRLAGMGSDETAESIDSCQLARSLVSTTAEHGGRHSGRPRGWPDAGAD